MRAFPLSGMVVSRPLNCLALVRDTTRNAPICARRLVISSEMPAANGSSSAPPRFSRGRTASLGGSSGINIAGAVRLARDLGPGKTIVTVLCDYGNRYQSKLFNPEFLRSKNLPVPHWLEAKAPIDWQSVVEAEPVA